MIKSMYLYGTIQQSSNLSKMQQDIEQQSTCEQRRFSEVLKQDIAVQATKVQETERGPKNKKYQPNEPRKQCCYNKNNSEPSAENCSSFDCTT